VTVEIQIALSCQGMCVGVSTRRFDPNTGSSLALKWGMNTSYAISPFITITNDIHEIKITRSS